MCCYRCTCFHSNRPRNPSFSGELKWCLNAHLVPYFVVVGFVLHSTRAHFLWLFYLNRTVYNNQNANTLMSALLHFVARMVEQPPTMFGLHSGGSIVYGLAESLLSIFTFRRNTQDFLTSPDLPAAFKEHYPLANQSLLLILILTNHHTASSKQNKYRHSLFGCSDSKSKCKRNGTQRSIC